MTTKGKLVTLELVVGLFGWIWIIASIAALVFFVMAIGFDGQWSRFFWALGIGIVAKWFTKGLQDNKIRVAFEAKMIAEGMSPEEARREWNKQYLGQNYS
jgi:hypothetical protein